MANRLPLVLILALTACGGSPLGIAPSTPKATSQPDVVALSRTAVEDAKSAQQAPDASKTDTGEQDASVVSLGASMKAQAVPMKDAQTPSESPPKEEAGSSQPATPMATFSLRRGETLAHFARWSGFPVEDIAKFSGLTLDGDYPVGTKIQLPVSGEHLAEIEAKREEHLKKRVDGYLASRGGSVGNEFYTVHTGDTAWSIAKDDYGMPVWLLEAYNPKVDLDHLRPGQELLVPKLGDTVADAGTSTPAPVASDSKSASQSETASQSSSSSSATSSHPASGGSASPSPTPSGSGPVMPPAE